MTRPGERGAALLAVLAMAALLAGLTAVGLDRLKAATGSARDAAELAEVQLSTSAAVALAQGLIARVKAEANRRVEVIERPIDLVLGGHPVRLRFRNAGTCFNLNSLGARGEDASARAFGRMLAAAGMPAGAAADLATRSRERIGRSGRLLADTREWRALVDLSEDQFTALSPLLCTLPTREPSGFNVNSLSARDLPLLVALGLREEQARRALAGRPEGGWGSGSDFWAAAAGNDGPEAPEALLGTTARWMTLEVDVRADGLLHRRRLLLDTARQPAQVVASQWLRPLPMPPAAEIGA
jgi:general secretion pathway protein K